MTNKRRILIIMLLVAAVSWFLLRPDPKLSYHGRPLSYWLKAYHEFNSSQSPSSPSRVEADEAVRHIGTNAIPTLLRLLKAKDSKFKLKLIELAQKQHLIKLKFTTTDTRHIQAVYGFLALAAQGKTAVPDLLQILNDTERRSGSFDGPVMVVLILGNMGPAAADTVPQLLQAAADTNYWDLHSRAIYALGEIHSKPDLTVPALTGFLRDPNDFVRATATVSLAAFGEDAKAAVPELIKTLADPSSNVANDAAIALKKIDPEAAAKAGVK